jgi:hypothetical protein
MFTAKCSRIILTPRNLDLYRHTRNKITATAMTAQHIVINVFSNFEDQEERLHQRDSSCSFIIIAYKLLEFVSCIAFIISLTEFVCSYSALSNGLETGLMYRTS